MTAIKASVEDVRHFFAAVLARRVGAKDPRIERVFAETDRARFLGPGPWKIFGGVSTPSDDPVFVYQSVVFFIDEEAGITNGEPGIHVRYMDLMKIQPGETIVQIGTGGGYYTSILADLVGLDGRVIGYEIHEPTARLAITNLAGRSNIEIRATSGAETTLPQADIIYVSAGSTRPMPTWLAAMKPGARLLFHLTDENNLGATFIATREEDGFSIRSLGPVGFIPCIGARDPAGSAAIARAMNTSSPMAVRSLRLAPEVPDETAWLAGDGWWLSTKPLRRSN